MPIRSILEAPELGAPRYNGQNVGFQWSPLWRGSTVCGYVHLHKIKYIHTIIIQILRKLKK